MRMGNAHAVGTFAAWKKKPSPFPPCGHHGPYFGTNPCALLAI